MQVEFDGYTVSVSDATNASGELAWLAVVYKGNEHLQTYTVGETFRQYVPEKYLSETQRVALKAIAKCA